MAFLKRLSQSQLARGSLLVFIGSNTASFGNFLYNILMGRFLGSDLYGDLGAIFSLLVIISVPLSVLSMIIVKTTSSYWGNKEKSKIKGFLSYVTPKLFVSGLVIALILIASSPWIAQFLKLDDVWPVVIISLYFVFSVAAVANRATLSGTLSFFYTTLNGFVEVGLKLVVSVILVLLNLKLYGALLGPFVGLVVGYIFSYYELRLILKDAKTSPVSYKFKEVVNTSLPFLFITFALNLMINSDIILVKHFFDAKTAGDYVALSTAGKIIFYAVGPVISVMFPLVSNRVENGTSYALPLLGTLVLALGLNLILVFSYFLFPKAILSVLYGGNYQGAIPYMGIFAFFISVYTVNSILSYFLISVSYYKPVYYLFAVSILQGILLFFFHNSISQVIYINILVSIVYLLVIGLWTDKKRIFR